MKATLSKYQQSPRKVRLIADSLRGMRVDKALMTLEFMPKRAAKTLHKLLTSALSNATGDNADNLVISELQVNEGPRYRRFRPGFRGRADKYYKRTSHIQLGLAKITSDAKVKSDKKPTAKKTTAKSADKNNKK